jgi:hypothetical protein
MNLYKMRYISGVLENLSANRRVLFPFASKYKKATRTLVAFYYSGDPSGIFISLRLTKQPALSA